MGIESGIPDNSASPSPAAEQIVEEKSEQVQVGEPEKCVSSAEQVEEVKMAIAEESSTAAAHDEAEEKQIDPPAAPKDEEKLDAPKVEERQAEPDPDETEAVAEASTNKVEIAEEEAEGKIGAKDAEPESEAVDVVKEDYFEEDVKASESSDAVEEPTQGANSAELTLDAENNPQEEAKAPVTIDDPEPKELVEEAPIQALEEDVIEAPIQFQAAEEDATTTTTTQDEAEEKQIDPPAAHKEEEKLEVEENQAEPDQDATEAAVAAASTDKVGIAEEKTGAKQAEPELEAVDVKEDYSDECVNASESSDAAEVSVTQAANPAENNPQEEAKAPMTIDDFEPEEMVEEEDVVEKKEASIQVMVLEGEADQGVMENTDDVLQAAYSMDSQSQLQIPEVEPVDEEEAKQEDDVEKTEAPPADIQKPKCEEIQPREILGSLMSKEEGNQDRDVQEKTPDKALLIAEDADEPTVELVKENDVVTNGSTEQTQVPAEEVAENSLEEAIEEPKEPEKTVQEEAEVEKTETAKPEEQQSIKGAENIKDVEESKEQENNQVKTFQEEAKVEKTETAKPEEQQSIKGADYIKDVDEPEDQENKQVKTAEEVAKVEETETAKPEEQQSIKDAETLKDVEEPKDQENKQVKTVQKEAKVEETETAKPEEQQSIKDAETIKDVEEPKEQAPTKPLKQSNNLISKMKQSLVKAKKAIIGKSPVSKSVSTETKG